MNSCSMVTPKNDVILRQTENSQIYYVQFTKHLDIVPTIPTDTFTN